VYTPRLLAAILGLLPALCGQDLKTAASLYQHTDYAGALRVLESLTPLGAPAWLLIGKSRLMKGDLKQATEAFEKAASLVPADSEAMLWLGRSWGRRAESANPLIAPIYAVRARDYFEKAAAMNPANRDALGDLFEYYLEAPVFLGGGLKKAQMVAARIAEFDPPESHYDYARIARKGGDLAEAERHLRLSVKQGPNQIGHVLALARILSEEGRAEECQATLAAAERISPGSPRVLYERARIYLAEGSHRDEALELLKKYLQCNLTPDDPSRESVEKILRRAEGG